MRAEPVSRASLAKWARVREWRRREQSNSWLAAGLGRSADGAQRSVIGPLC
jgi:hypothetical protein